MEYIIKIIKKENRNEEDMMMNKMMEVGIEDVKFRGEMDADSCIEILQHLHDIKNRGTKG